MTFEGGLLVQVRPPLRPAPRPRQVCRLSYSRLQPSLRSHRRTPLRTLSRAHTPRFQSCHQHFSYKNQFPPLINLLPSQPVASPPIPPRHMLGFRLASKTGRRRQVKTCAYLPFKKQWLGTCHLLTVKEGMLMTHRPLKLLQRSRPGTLH